MVQIRELLSANKGGKWVSKMVQSFGIDFRHRTANTPPALVKMLWTAPEYHRIFGIDVASNPHPAA